MRLQQLDHLVLTVADIDLSVDFYTRVLGMRKIEFGEGRIALSFGEQKINLHRSGHEFKPHAGQVQAGSGDLCFIVDDDIDQVCAELRRLNVDIIDGPVPRTGARGPIRSIYLRDPDANLIELSNYV